MKIRKALGAIASLNSDRSRISKSDLYYERSEDDMNGNYVIGVFVVHGTEYVEISVTNTTVDGNVTTTYGTPSMLPKLKDYFVDRWIELNDKEVVQPHCKYRVPATVF